MKLLASNDIYYKILIAIITRAKLSQGWACLAIRPVRCVTSCCLAILPQSGSLRRARSARRHGRAQGSQRETTAAQRQFCGAQLHLTRCLRHTHASRAPVTHLWWRVRCAQKGSTIRWRSRSGIFEKFFKSNFFLNFIFLSINIF